MVSTTTVPATKLMPAMLSHTIKTLMAMDMAMPTMYCPRVIPFQAMSPTTQTAMTTTRASPPSMVDGDGLSACDGDCDDTNGAVTDDCTYDSYSGYEIFKYRDGTYGQGQLNCQIYWDVASTVLRVKLQHLQSSSLSLTSPTTPANPLTMAHAAASMWIPLFSCL